MKLLPWLALPAIALSLVCPAVAQESTEPTTASESETVKSERSVPNNNNAAARLIPPRWSVDYNSSGGGYDGFGGFSFMLPVQQRPGQQMNYLLGRLNLTNGGDVGGNILFGHRELGKCLFSQQNCFLGGYIGVDVTNTSETVFPQLGLGLEMLSDLEMRLNGYLAVGNSQKLVEEARFTAPTGLQFQDSNLLFIDQSSRDRFQNALSGFDVELGGKLVQLGNGGDLRGYGAVYSYGGPQVDRYVGGRFRLEARPNDVWRIGAGVQFDREFGTNLLFQIAATFPSLGQGQARTPGGPTLDQLADSPLRQTAVVVADRSVPVTTVGPVAVNPSTGKTYEFIHVAPGRGNSSGTFEDPMNTISEATELASPTTDIIYVQPGNAGGGFTIPDGIAVLSVAPLQMIATQFGQVPLPGSGQGEAAQPIITDTVTMGNNTALSGFVVQPPVNRLGVVANNVRNIEIRDNRIGVTNTLSGSELFRALDITFPSDFNPLSGFNTLNSIFPRFAGILVINDSNSGNAKISDNQITTSGEWADGISGIGFSGSSVTITHNQVTTSGEWADGIGASSLLDSSITIGSNIVQTSGTGSDGIRGDSGFCTSGHYYFTRTCQRGGSVTLADNIVKTSGTFSNAIVGESFDTSSFSFRLPDGLRYVSREPATSITISGNTVSTSGDTAIGIKGFGPATISGNTVMTSGNSADGIGGSGSASFIPTRIDWSGSTAISHNTITTSGNSADGIRYFSSPNVNVTIADNTIANSGRDGVRVESPGFAIASPPTCIALSNNISQNSGSRIGYHLIDSVNPSNSFVGIFQIIDSSPVFADTRASNIGTFVFEPDLTSFTNVLACP